MFGGTLSQTVRLIANDFIIHRKIVNDSDIEILRVDLDRLGGVGGRKCDENKSRYK
jgi:hypothetical protein